MERRVARSRRRRPRTCRRRRLRACRRRMYHRPTASMLLRREWGRARLRWRQLSRTRRPPRRRAQSRPSIGCSPQQLAPRLQRGEHMLWVLTKTRPHLICRLATLPCALRSLLHSPLSLPATGRSRRPRSSLSRRRGPPSMTLSRAWDRACRGELQRRMRRRGRRRLRVLPRGRLSSLCSSSRVVTRSLARPSSPQ